MSEPIRLLIVDDQRLIRDGLSVLASLEPDLQVVGEAADGEEAVTAYTRHRPDVVLMDIRMPALDGVAATRQIRALDPAAKIIILTTFDEDATVFEALRSGAMGYLLKDVSGQDLAAAIRAVAGGQALFGSAVADRVLAEFARSNPVAREAPADLSAREVEILQLVAEGLSNKAIADRLFLAEGTVKNYVSAILQKMGVRDRTQAALRAQKAGWL